MDTNVFRYVVAVVESGSISAASRKLFMSQSALTKQISKLENQLGLKLLERNKTDSAMECVLVATTHRGGGYAGEHTAAFWGRHPEIQLEYLDMSAKRL